MSDMFREVDEAMQQEKMMNLWKQHGSTLIAALIVLVLSTSVMTYYYKWDANRNAAETARLTEALQSETPEAALMELSKDTRKGHSAIAAMSAANLKLSDGNKAEAATLYKQVADNSKSPRNIRDLARVLYVQNADAPDIAILKPLLSNAKSPWLWHAKIEAAVMTAHNDNDYAKALTYLEDFDTAKFVPATLKQRANALAHVYKLKAAKNTPAATPTETKEK